ncbi:hypothetical protein [Shewanella sp. TC10]|uniref:hypothetical protein n=1 Tax=Shewanella sp. TC10 TaxID=1419739 RepID=UPI00129D896E|nr:hypothetical protein [Shewanella sp. TC10]
MSINKLAVSTLVLSSLFISGCSSTSSTESATPTPETPNYTLSDQAKDAYAARVDGGWGLDNGLDNPIEKETPPNQPKYTIADQLKDAYAARVDSDWGLSGTPVNPIEDEKELPIYIEPTNPIEIPDYGDTPEFGLYKVVYDADSGQLKIYDRSNQDATVAIITVEQGNDDNPTVVIRHGAMEDDNTYAIIKTEDGIAIDWDSPYTKIDNGFDGPLATDTVVALLNGPALTEQQVANVKARFNNPTNKAQLNKQNINQLKKIKSQLNMPSQMR